MILAQRIFRYTFTLVLLSRIVLAANVPASFIANPPERYRVIEANTRELLAQSVLEQTLIEPDSRGFAGESLWQFLDERFTTAQLQTIVQIHSAAQKQGMSQAIARLRSVYAGTSWGIKFYGDERALRERAKRSDFCHDLDAIVRREHGNTAHSWWRHLGEQPGLGALHLGVSEGAPYHDLHIDTTNPAKSKGSLGSAELCSYAPLKVIEHNFDIRDDAYSSELRDFLLVDLMGYFHKRLVEALAHDLKYSSQESQLGWSAMVQKMLDLRAQFDAFVHAVTSISVRFDGIERLRTELGAEFSSQKKLMTAELLAFSALTLDEGRRSGYFARGAEINQRFAVLPSITMSLSTLNRQTHEPQTAKDLQTLRDVRARLAKDGAAALKAHDIDSMIGIFFRVRRYSKGRLWP